MNLKINKLDDNLRWCHDVATINYAFISLRPLIGQLPVLNPLLKIQFEPRVDFKVSTGSGDEDRKTAIRNVSYYLHIICIQTVLKEKRLKLAKPCTSHKTLPHVEYFT